MPPIATVRPVGVGELSTSQAFARLRPSSAASLSLLSGTKPKAPAVTAADEARATAFMKAGGASAATIANTIANLRAGQVTMVALEAQYAKKPAAPPGIAAPFNPPLVAKVTPQPTIRPVVLAPVAEPSPNARKAADIASNAATVPRKATVAPAFAKTGTSDPFGGARIAVAQTVSPVPTLAPRPIRPVEESVIVPTGNTNTISRPVNTAPPSAPIPLRESPQPPSILLTREWTDMKRRTMENAPARPTTPGLPAQAPADGPGGNRLWIAAAVLAAGAIAFAVYRS